MVGFLALYLAIDQGELGFSPWLWSQFVIVYVYNSDALIKLSAHYSIFHGLAVSLAQLLISQYFTHLLLNSELMCYSQVIFCMQGYNIPKLLNLFCLPDLTLWVWGFLFLLFDTPSGKKPQWILSDYSISSYYYDTLNICKF